MMATDGNLDAWNRLWDVANAGFDTDEPYYRVQGLNVDGTPNRAYERLLDVDNLIDYMLVIFYGGNLDSPVGRFNNNNNPNNVYVIYNRRRPDGFKSFIHDAEHTLLVDDVHGYGDELYTDRTGPFPAGSSRDRFNPQWLHQQLAAHPEYRMRFADRTHRHFFNQGLLTPDVSTARFMARAAEIDLAIIAESARWGDANSSRPRTKDDHWQRVIDAIVETWFPQRTGIVLGQLRAKGLYPSNDAAVFNLNGRHQHGGHLSAGDVLTITNPNESGTVYYTLDGSDPRLRNSQAASSSAVEYTVPLTLTGTTHVSARVRDAHEWSALNEATYVLPVVAGNIRVTEMMYHPEEFPSGNPDAEFVELQNMGSQTMNLVKTRFTKGIHFTFPNTQLGPKDSIIVVKDQAAFAQQHPAFTATIAGEYTGGLAKAQEGAGVGPS